LDERSGVFETKYNQMLFEFQTMADDQEINGGSQVIQPTYRYSD
jgi:hypothetical protein